jgi:hypothetical protein
MAQRWNCQGRVAASATSTTAICPAGTARRQRGRIRRSLRREVVPLLPFHGIQGPITPARPAGATGRFPRPVHLGSGRQPVPVRRREDPRLRLLARRTAPLPQPVVRSAARPDRPEAVAQRAEPCRPTLRLRTGRIQRDRRRAGPHGVGIVLEEETLQLGDRLPDLLDSTLVRGCEAGYRHEGGARHSEHRVPPVGNRRGFLSSRATWSS